MLLQFAQTWFSLAEVLIFSLTFSQDLFMSSPQFQLSKTASMLKILICHCFLTASSFSFLILIFSHQNSSVACLLTANLSLTFATTRQWSVSQSALLKHCTSITLECHLLSINIWSVWLWVFPSEEIQVYLWMFRCDNIVHLTIRFFVVAKFTILISSLLPWRKLSIPFSVMKY